MSNKSKLAATYKFGTVKVRQLGKAGRVKARRLEEASIIQMSGVIEGYEIAPPFDDGNPFKAGIRSFSVVHRYFVAGKSYQIRLSDRTPRAEPGDRVRLKFKMSAGGFYYIQDGGLNILQPARKCGKRGAGAVQAL